MARTVVDHLNNEGIKQTFLSEKVEREGEKVTVRSYYWPKQGTRCPPSRTGDESQITSRYLPSEGIRRMDGLDNRDMGGEISKENMGEGGDEDNYL